jgi:hypothetical protein
MENVVLFLKDRTFSTVKETNITPPLESNYRHIFAYKRIIIAKQPAFKRFVLSKAIRFACSTGVNEAEMRLNQLVVKKRELFPPEIQPEDRSIMFIRNRL